MNIVKRRTYIIDDTVNYIMKYVPSGEPYSNLFPSFNIFYKCIVNNASINVAGEIYGGDLNLASEIRPFIESYLDLKWKDLILSTYEHNINHH